MKYFSDLLEIQGTRLFLLGAGTLILSFVLIALLLWGFVPEAALIGTQVIWITFILSLNRRYQDNINDLADYVEALTDPNLSKDSRPILPNARGVQKVDAALTTLEQHWQQRLRRLSDQLNIEQTVLDILSDPLFLLNSERKTIQANRAAKDAFGSKILYADIAQFLRDVAAISAIDAVLGGEPAMSFEFTLPGPIERIFQVDVSPFRRSWVNPFSTEASASWQHTTNPKEQPAVLVVMSDITVLKRAEATRIDFIANISHELRTPLTSIIGFIETIRGPVAQDYEKRTEFLGIMHDQASRMSRLVSDLLSLSKIELTEYTAPDEPVDIVNLINSLRSMMEMRAAERGMTIEIEAPNKLPVVIADRDQIIQALQNLIENAVKYGREKTVIKVKAILHDDGGQLPLAATAKAVIALSVCNQGEPIPPEHLSRLTERFYRVDSSRNRRIQGTGLGLAIVKHIIRRHHGRLTITSDAEHGTVFTIYLPAMAKA